MSILDEKKKELRDAQYTYRKSCRDDLVKYVGPGKISPHVAAVFLGRSFKTIYSWLAEKLFLPTLEDCEKINKLCSTADSVRESWKKVVMSHGTHGHINGAVKMALYNQSFLKILEDEKMPIAEKVKALTIKTFRAWAKDLEEK